MSGPFQQGDYALVDLSGKRSYRWARRAALALSLIVIFLAAPIAKFPVAFASETEHRFVFVTENIGVINGSEEKYEDATSAQHINVACGEACLQGHLLILADAVSANSSVQITDRIRPHKWGLVRDAIRQNEGGANIINASNSPTAIEERPIYDWGVRLSPVVLGLVCDPGDSIGQVAMAWQIPKIRPLQTLAAVFATPNGEPTDNNKAISEINDQDVGQFKLPRILLASCAFALFCCSFTIGMILLTRDKAATLATLICGPIFLAGGMFGLLLIIPLIIVGGALG